MERLYGRIILSIMLSGLSLPFIIGLINMFVMPFCKNSALKKAKLDGHVVKAKHIKNIYAQGDDISKRGSDILGIYEYTVGSKKYKFRGYYVGTPPNIEILYYKTNPKKARPDVQFGFLEGGKSLIFVIVSIIIFLGSFFVL